MYFNRCFLIFLSEFYAVKNISTIFKMNLKEKKTANDV